MKPIIHLIRAAFIFFLCVSSFNISLAQYTTSGPLSGSTFSDDNSVGNFAFSIPGNAVTSDNNRSTADALLILLNGNTHYLKVTGFGFSIPPLSSITGIKVEVEKSAWDISILATVKDNSIKLVKGGTPVGTNQAKSSSWTDTDNYSVYGDTTDDWGTTWTPDDINDPDFGVVVSAKIAGLVSLIPTARVDHIRVTVFYITSLPIHFLNFKAETKKENEVLLKWSTADNDEKALFTVQRSADGNIWTDIKNIPGMISPGIKEYEYVDKISTDIDRYLYRIKMTLRSGAALYTKIVYTDIRRQDVFRLYPNPAKDHVVVLSGSKEDISLFSLSGEKIKVNLENINANQVKINTSFLRPGLYVVKAGDRQRQLLIQ